MTTPGQPPVAHTTIPASPNGGGPPALGAALGSLRDLLAGISYPLILPSAEQARRAAAALVGQFDDYLLPRLDRLAAPLLVVVGGSTGAGKSTLVNSLVRAPVSPAGVLRPTTRAPVLAAHPDDAPWFRQATVLPSLTRTNRTSDDPRTLRLVTAPALTPGLALLDAPDIDSVVATNRALAAQLHAAADLWLFVTSAARYADAVPWDMLQMAAYRGTVLAIVLDRAPPEAAEEVVADFTHMLSVNGFAGVPLFVLPETALDGQGLLSEDEVAVLAEWLSRLAADPATREAVVRQTVDGALAAVEPVVEVLAAAADDQAAATAALTDRVATAYRTARRKIDQGVRDGALLRGEVLARWKEFVGGGRRAAVGRELSKALASGVAALVQAAAEESAEQAYGSWRRHPAGVGLLRPDLARASTGLPLHVERLVADWQARVLELAGGKAGLLVMMSVLAPDAAVGLLGEGGDGLAEQARDDLLARVDALLDAEAGRYLALLPTAGVDLPSADLLSEAAARVEQARSAAALTAETGPVVLTLPPGVDA